MTPVELAKKKVPIPFWQRKIFYRAGQRPVAGSGIVQDEPERMIGIDEGNGSRRGHIVHRDRFQGRFLLRHSSA